MTEQMLHRLPNRVLLAREDVSRAYGKEIGTLKFLESIGYRSFFLTRMLLWRFVPLEHNLKQN